MMILTGCLCLVSPGYSQADTVYLYQLEDGSRVLSDKPIRDRGARLVRRSGQIKNMGSYAARRTVRARIYEDRLQNLIEHFSTIHKVDADLVKAVIKTESYFNPHATSHKGASGLMQLMPATAEKYGVYDLYNPRQNIEAGIKHLSYLLQRYPDKLSHAIAAYNAGVSAVEKYKGIPPYQETRRYVKKVMAYLKEYRKTSQ